MLKKKKVDMYFHNKNFSAYLKYVIHLMKSLMQ